MRALSTLIALVVLVGPITIVAQTFTGKPIRIHLSEVPAPKAPAELHITELQFKELGEEKNEMLDAGESAEVRFMVSNKGKGEAYRVHPQIIRGVSDGLSAEALPIIGLLKPDESKWITIKLKASSDVKDGSCELEILVKEGNGFDADPIVLNFKTYAFRPPSVVIADAVFTNNEGEGKVTLGKLVSLDVLVQNGGQGIAKDISVQFQLPDKVFPAGESVMKIPELQANQKERLRFEFFANKLFTGNEIQITVITKESYGSYGGTFKFAVSLEKSLSRTQTLQLTGRELQKVEITQASLVSDIGRNIPDCGKTYSNRYALIIGNEEYSRFQRGLLVESNVSYARNDALTVKSYFESTLGIPSTNIDLKLDATSGEMSQAIDRLKRIIKNTSGQAEIFVYYAGHGLPSDKKEPYLMPVDVTGANVTLGVNLSDMYTSLAEYPSKRVTVILDACFSGGARGETLLAMRGVKITPNQQRVKGNMVVIAASSGDQPSLPYHQQQHGIFTYFLLKKLQQSNGILSYGELVDYLQKEVSLQSVLINDKEQNPNVIFSDDIESTWSAWKF